MKINWISTITAFITPIAIILIFKLLSKTKSLKIPDTVKDFEATAEQQRLYKKYMGCGALVMIVFGGAIALVLYFVLLRIGKIYFSLMQPYDAIYAMPNAAIGLPALFTSILILGSLSKYLTIKIYGQENYQVFSQLTDKQYRFNNEKLGKIMIKWGLIISALFYINVLKTTSYVLHDKIKLMGFLSLQPKEYPLKEIKEIVVSLKQKAPNGKLVTRPRYHIIFNDDFHWELDSEGDSQEFLRMLQFKTGVAVREVEFMESTN